MRRVAVISQGHSLIRIRGASHGDRACVLGARRVERQRLRQRTLWLSLRLSEREQQLHVRGEVVAVKPSRLRARPSAGRRLHLVS
jgi:hypothetical protein